MRVLALVLALLCQANYAFADASNTCDLQTSRSAETEQSTLKTWEDIYNSFIRFAKCDDGGVAEGYSDFVVHHLATQWGTLHQAAIFADKDPAFRAFFLSHINASADTKELRNIEIFSKTKCDAKLKQLCVAIGDQAQKAIIEDMSVYSNPK